MRCKTGFLEFEGFPQGLRHLKNSIGTQDGQLDFIDRAHASMLPCVVCQCPSLCGHGVFQPSAQSANKCAACVAGRAAGIVVNYTNPPPPPTLGLKGMQAAPATSRIRTAPLLRAAEPKKPAPRAHDQAGTGTLNKVPFEGARSREVW